MKKVDLDNFEEPWEHVRLLSDAPRNRALIELLSRHAPGQRVLEVGCGTGLLSCVAARLGATKVVAVEPTGLVEEAERMVEANDLGDIVEVVEGRVQDVDPREVDFAFSELFNADPFEECVLEAMLGARDWLAPGGTMAPRRLVVKAALLRETASAGEVRSAQREVARLAEEHNLVLDGLRAVIAEPGVYRWFHTVRELAGDPVVVWDLEVGVDLTPEEPVEITLHTHEPGPVGAVVIWWEAELDEVSSMTNAPGAGGHWGQLVCGWPQEVGVPMDGGLKVAVWVDDDGVYAEAITEPPQ